MKRIAALLLLCLLLTGCSWDSAEYYSATPHKIKEQKTDESIPAVSNYNELYDAVADIVEKGAVTGRMSVEEYRSISLENNLSFVETDIIKRHPIGAYAVESIEFEVGTAVGMNAVGVTVNYSRAPEELQGIKAAKDMEKAKTLIRETLTQCDSALVMRVTNYEETDFVQFVEDFAAENPDVVMELPQVTVSVYPESGDDRVVDIRLSYQTSRESLRQMQKYVQPVFTSASLYVSSEEEGAIVRYARLYTFLMERNAYKVETSITPSYSLLRHGVGDHRAFATVYAAMCRKAGLECFVVTGTRNGDARSWNIVRDGDYYYHVDLLSQSGFILYKDNQMNGYVWDYSAYPACGVAQQPAENNG